MTPAMILTMLISQFLIALAMREMIAFLIAKWELLAGYQGEI